jgi:Protein of unknown function (DUF2835)
MMRASESAERVCATVTEHTVVVELAIDADDMLRYYRGEVREVVARASDGRIVRFPVQSLRPFVGADGVQGRFRVVFDSCNRLVRLTRVE